MKKFILALLLMGALVLLNSCATSQPVGVFYTDIRLPLATGVEMDGSQSLKVGVAASKSILGLIATGDSSISAACANGGISKIHHVDWEATSVFGLYSTYRCVVWGQ